MVGKIVRFSHGNQVGNQAGLSALARRLIKPGYVLGGTIVLAALLSGCTGTSADSGAAAPLGKQSVNENEPIPLFDMKALKADVGTNAAVTPDGAPGQMANEAATDGAATDGANAQTGQAEQPSGLAIEQKAGDGGPDKDIIESAELMPAGEEAVKAEQLAAAKAEEEEKAAEKEAKKPDITVPQVAAAPPPPPPAQPARPPARTADTKFDMESLPGWQRIGDSGIFVCRDKAICPERQMVVYQVAHASPQEISAVQSTNAAGLAGVVSLAEKKYSKTVRTQGGASALNISGRKGVSYDATANNVAGKPRKPGHMIIAAGDEKLHMFVGTAGDAQTAKSIAQAVAAAMR